MAAKFAIVSMKAVVEAKRLDPHFFIEDDGPEVLKARQIVDNHKQRLAQTSHRRESGCAAQGVAQEDGEGWQNQNHFVRTHDHR